MFSLCIDAAGSKATGKENGSIGLSLDSPLRLHDQLIVSYSGDLENENQRGNEAHSISYSIPFKAWLLSLSGGRSRYRQQITGLAQALSSSGFSATQDAKLTRTLWRDQTTRISAYGRLFIPFPVQKDIERGWTSRQDSTRGTARRRVRHPRIMSF